MLVALFDNLELVEPMLLVVITLPLLVAAGLAFGDTRRAASLLAPWMALPAVLLSVVVSPGHSEMLDWLVLGTLLSYDEIGRIFLFFTGWIWLLSGLFANYSLDEKGRNAFWAFYLLALSGNLGVALTRDLPGFLFFFSLMGFASYGLVLHRRDKAAIRAARVYIVLLVVGEALLYAAAVLAAINADSFEAAAIADAVARSPQSGLIMVLFFGGFATKAGIFPLHISLPPAYDAAPASAGAVLSGAMSKAGVLGWMLFLPVGLDVSPVVGPDMVSDTMSSAISNAGLLFLLAGLFSVYYGVVVGLAQRTPKALLAYSSISQIGYMALLIGVGLQSGQMWEAALVATAVYALHHGLNKGALFLSVRLCEDGVSGRWPRRLLLGGLLLPSLALAGAPLTTGAVAKNALKKSLDVDMLTVGAWFETLIVVGSVGTALLLARFIFLVWPAPPEEKARVTGSPHQNPPRGLWIPWGLSLVSIIVVPWVFPWDEMQKLTADVLSWSKIWSEVWPLLVATLLVIVAVRAFRHYLWGQVVRIPPGDLLLPLGWLTLLLLHSTGRALDWVQRETNLLQERTIHFVTRPTGLASKSREFEAWLTGFHIGITLVVVLAGILIALAAVGP